MSEAVIKGIANVIQTILLIFLAIVLLTTLSEIAAGKRPSENPHYILSKIQSKSIVADTYNLQVVNDDSTVTIKIVSIKVSAQEYAKAKIGDEICWKGYMTKDSELAKASDCEVKEK